MLVRAVDEAGDLFVVERDGHRVRKIDMKTRIVSTVVGTGEKGFAGDGGSATAARLNQPHSIQVCLSLCGVYLGVLAAAFAAATMAKHLLLGTERD